MIGDQSHKFHGVVDNSRKAVDNPSHICGRGSLIKI